jgi:hypothetical protein
LEGIPLLKDIVILMAVSVPISILLTRLGLPTIVGFLLTGVIIGPYGFGLVTRVEEVEVLAQIGVVLLLFTIGLEFSVARMLKIRGEAMWGGGLQLLFTITLVWFFSSAMGQPFAVALLLGFIVSLSSSAIVLKLLVDSGEVGSSHGNLSREPLRGDSPFPGHMRGGHGNGHPRPRGHGRDLGRSNRKGARHSNSRGVHNSRRCGVPGPETLPRGGKA